MGSGNRPLKKTESLAAPKTITCLHCNQKLSSKEFYDSDSKLYRALGKVPYCKECLEEIYQDYYKKYSGSCYPSPDRKAVERICMFIDLYYSDKIFDSALLKFESDNFSDSTLIALYFQRAKLYQYRNRDYDTTIVEKFNVTKDEKTAMSVYTDADVERDERIRIAVELFGGNFKREDYIYLYEQYTDWTARHECNTKTQEEIFKQICFTQLEILKKTQSGADTKDAVATLTKLLDAGKLQPKQNSSDAVSEAQTFGTLIDKWENTRPIPEIDEELKDVDKIGLYLDVFFRGHLAKMMGLKNGLSNLYTKFMKKYTVEKPEYDGDDSNEALFDAIFGSSITEDDGEEDG